MNTLQNVALIVGGMAFLAFCFWIIDSVNNSVDAFWNWATRKNKDKSEG